MKNRIFKLAAMLMVMGPVPSMAAPIIYDFMGICDSDCTTMTGVLTLSDTYTPGDPIAYENSTGGGVFISFLMFADGSPFATIMSTNYQLQANGQGLDGGLLPGVAGIPAFDVDIISVSASGSTSGINDTLLNGDWFSLSSIDSGLRIEGTEGTWTLRDNAPPELPEPGTLALLGLGLAGLGLTRRRRKPASV